MDEEEREMIIHYRNLGLRIERTETFNDCGIDTMSLMLGEERTLANRTEIRRKLVQFCNDHRGNRALISMLCRARELIHNLGDHDLESVAAELFTHRCRGVEPAEQCSEIAVPKCRDFTVEEINAVRSKLNMHKSSASFIAMFMARLSEHALSSLVESHKSVVAEPPAPMEKQPIFILGKDSKQHLKNGAIRTLFDWTNANYGLGKVELMRRMGKMPRGIFAEFVRDNTVLKHHCTVDN